MEEKGEGVSREELVGPRIGRRGQDRALRAEPAERKRAEPRVGAGESRRGAGGAGGWSGRSHHTGGGGGGGGCARITW